MREFAARPARAPIEVRVDLKTGNETFAATTRNLGVGGLFVATDRQLRVGERVTVELSLPDHVRPIPVAAELSGGSRRRRSDRAGWACGF